jgi:hypothetical protein
VPIMDDACATRLRAEAIAFACVVSELVARA